MASEFPKWRTELPTEPGWYWFQRSLKHKAEVVRVGGISRWDGGMVVHFTGDDSDQPMSVFGYCRWQGPISPNEDTP